MLLCVFNLKKMITFIFNNKKKSISSSRTLNSKTVFLDTKAVFRADFNSNTIDLTYASL